VHDNRMSIARQRRGKHTSSKMQAVFSTWSEQSAYKKCSAVQNSSIPCGGGVEYPHCSPASRRRRRKGNLVPGGITGPPCSWGI
jgi:hypothetical protein